MAKLVPYIPPQPARKGGFLSGKIWASEDCGESDGGLIEAMTSTSLEAFK